MLHAAAPNRANTPAPQKPKKTWIGERWELETVLWRHQCAWNITEFATPVASMTSLTKHCYCKHRVWIEALYVNIISRPVTCKPSWLVLACQFHIKQRDARRIQGTIRLLDMVFRSVHCWHLFWAARYPRWQLEHRVPVYPRSILSNVGHNYRKHSQPGQHA